MTNRHTYIYNHAEIDGHYRYELWRAWDDLRPQAVFIMLNPSTADAMQDDNTIARCVDFAKRDGFGSILVLNLFAFRATDPEVMMKAPDPIGVDNDDAITTTAARLGKDDKVIAAWGNTGIFKDRAKAVLELLRPLCDVHALHVTRGGHPGHPLYLPKDTELQLFQARTTNGKEAAVGQVPST